MVATIGVFTGSRAEFGLLLPVIREVEASPHLALQLFVGGTHFDPAHGHTIDEIVGAGLQPTACIVGQVVGDDGRAVARTSALTLVGMADALAANAPDLLLVLGDRYETLAAAQAAVLSRTPIGHLHGGEITAGAIDDVMRHAITKMAHLHFVAAEPFRRRVIQMGEQPSQVHTVGAPGLAHLADGPALEAAEAYERLQIVPTRPFFLATYHPETLAEDGGMAGLQAMLAAFDEYPGGTVVITGGNADPMGAAIARRIEAYVHGNPERVHFRQSLGLTLYSSLLFAADVVVGNSSSGIIEAPAAGTPTVNIGQRQAGRLRSTGVIDTPGEPAAVISALRRALSVEHRELTRRDGSVFGDGRTAARIRAVLEGVCPAALLHKHFNDLPSDTAESGPAASSADTGHPRLERTGG